MSISLDARAKCTGCGATVDIPAYGSINVRENPELKTAVKDGSLFLWECPECGSRNLIQYDTLYHDPDSRLMVWLLAEEGEDGGNMEKIADSLQDYTLRKVSDVGSLIEKVNIFDAGLDDMTMELCKNVTKMELAEKVPDKAEAIMAAPFKFFRIEGADNEITMTFPLDGAMQGVKIGFNVYEDCAGIIRRNPAMKAGTGFAVIDRDWIGRFFR